MKILKHGDLKPRKFICHICGCEFVADINEYYVTIANNKILWHVAECPDCGGETSASELWEEENDRS